MSREVARSGQALARSGVLACWRPPVFRRLRRWWIGGALIQVLGLLWAALTLAQTGRESPWQWPALALAGLGMLVALGGSLPILAEERCLLARRDGLEWLAPPAAPVRVGWHHLRGVEPLADGGGLCLVTDDPTQGRVLLAGAWSPAEAAALAALLPEVQRRVLLGLEVVAFAHRGAA